MKDGIIESMHDEQHETADGIAPNYEYLQCNGQIVVEAGVSLKRVGWDLYDGKWVVMPAQVLTGNSDNSWKACGNDSEMRGTKGRFIYETDDGDRTLIQLWFSVPFSGKNDAYIFGEGPSLDKYELICPKPSESGKEISPVYTIRKKVQSDPDVDPNAGDRICEGRENIGKDVNLRLVSKNLSYGKWEVNPAFTITGPYDGQFRACGRDGEAAGTEGTIKYQASDDAIFYLDFDVPLNKSNNVGIRCEGGDCKLYAYSVSAVPESGHKIMPTYTITRKK